MNDSYQNYFRKRNSIEREIQCTKMREKRLHLCQQINSIFLEFGTLNEKQFNEAIQIAIEVILSFSIKKIRRNLNAKPIFIWRYLKMFWSQVKIEKPSVQNVTQCWKKGFISKLKKLGTKIVLTKNSTILLYAQTSLVFKLALSDRLLSAFKPATLIGWVLWKLL